MRNSRLALALDTAALKLPDTGKIAVFGPRVGDDLSDLPKARVEVISAFRPDCDAFAAAGYAVRQSPAGPYAAAIVCLARAKAAARAQVAEAAAAVSPGGAVVVDGQKTDGIDTMLKDLRQRVAVSDPLSKAHGKVFSFVAQGDFDDWAARPTSIDGDFMTLPGVFSADGPDPGSRLLAEALPARLPARVIDLGAGWGYLSRAILAREGVRHLDLVEADAVALDCARQNVTDPRAEFHWADATTFRPAQLADAVVMNPPFHLGRAADASLGVAFLQAARRMLAPSGTLWLVANRSLPYLDPLATLFREVEDIGGSSAFRLIRASGAIRARHEK